MTPLSPKLRTTSQKTDPESTSSNDFLVLIIGRNTGDETATIISRLVARIGDLEDMLRRASKYDPFGPACSSWVTLRTEMHRVLNDPAVQARKN